MRNNNIIKVICLRKRINRGPFLGKQDTLEVNTFIVYIENDVFLPNVKEAAQGIILICLNQECFLLNIFKENKQKRLSYEQIATN